MHIRPVQPTDFDEVLRLAPRLLIGVDPSRPADRVRSAVDEWFKDSLEAAGTDGRGGWVAVIDHRIVGFVSVAEQAHWCGQLDAWIGELVVSEQYERQGVARALITTVEGWATQRGLGHVRLSTGAANHGAREFYDRLGYALNEVTLTRTLEKVVPAEVR